MDSNKKKCFVLRNKAPLLALAILYGLILYGMTFTLVQNDIHLIRDDVNKTLMIEVIKK